MVGDNPDSGKIPNKEEFSDNNADEYTTDKAESGEKLKPIIMKSEVEWSKSSDPSEMTEGEIKKAVNDSDED